MTDQAFVKKILKAVPGMTDLRKTLGDAEQAVTTLAGKIAGYNGRISECEDRIGNGRSEIEEEIRQGRDPGPASARVRGLRAELEDLLALKEATETVLGERADDAAAARVQIEQALAQAVIGVKVEVTASLGSRCREISAILLAWNEAVHSAAAQLGCATPPGERGISLSGFRDLWEALR